MIGDAPEAFEYDTQPGVAKFAELICGEDVQQYVDFMLMAMDYENDDGHHWEDDDHHWDDNDHDNDHDFHFAGADLGCKPSKERQ